MIPGVLECWKNLYQKKCFTCAGKHFRTLNVNCLILSITHIYDDANES